MENNQVKFEQGNQTRLDVTREELKTIEEALRNEIIHHRISVEETKSETVKKYSLYFIQKYEAVEKKVRYVLDMSGEEEN